MERGVLVVPLPIYERGATSALSSMDEVPTDDLRYACTCPAPQNPCLGAFCR